MQRGRGADLLAEIGRSVEKRPASIARGHGEPCLGARFDARVALPGELTHRAAAVPLRKSASGRRPEHDGGEAPHQPLRRVAGPVPGCLTSELGGQIAVDLESNADLNERRGRASKAIYFRPLGLMT